jgi:hypothetical protein
MWPPMARRPLFSVASATTPRQALLARRRRLDTGIVHSVVSAD